MTMNKYSESECNEIYEMVRNERMKKYNDLINSIEFRQHNMKNVKKDKRLRGEYLYLIREREFVHLKMGVYKLGRTSNYLHMRLGKYPTGSKLYLALAVDDSIKAETELKHIFKKEFEHCNIDENVNNPIGDEYYIGNVLDMMKIMIKYQLEHYSGENVTDMDIATYELCEDIKIYNKSVIEQANAIKTKNNDSIKTNVDDEVSVENTKSEDRACDGNSSVNVNGQVLDTNKCIDPVKDTKRTNIPVRDTKNTNIPAIDNKINERYKDNKSNNINTSKQNVNDNGKDNVLDIKNNDKHANNQVLDTKNNDKNTVISSDKNNASQQSDTKSKNVISQALDAKINSIIAISQVKDTKRTIIPVHDTKHTLTQVKDSKINDKHANNQVLETKNNDNNTTHNVKDTNNKYDITSSNKIDTTTQLSNTKINDKHVNTQQSDAKSVSSSSSKCSAIKLPTTYTPRHINNIPSINQEGLLTIQCYIDELIKLFKRELTDELVIKATQPKNLIIKIEYIKLVDKRNLQCRRTFNFDEIKFTQFKEYAKITTNNQEKLYKYKQNIKPSESFIIIIDPLYKVKVKAYNKCYILHFNDISYEQRIST